ncbi:hypothetical protein D9M73_134720 [compost metagenome]
MDQPLWIIVILHRIRELAERCGNPQVEHDRQLLQPVEQEIALGPRALRNPGETHLRDHLARQRTVHDDVEIAIAQRFQRLEREIPPKAEVLLRNFADIGDRTATRAHH